MRPIKLVFKNRDAAGIEGVTKVDEILIDREGAEKVMEWYGAYFAGDDYTVYANGQEIELDINGEWKHDTIDAEAHNPTP